MTQLRASNGHIGCARAASTESLLPLLPRPSADEADNFHPVPFL